MKESFPLCYETFGNPNDPCIILIMGIGGQLIHWPIEFTQGLVDQHFYVVTFDNRDSGLSQHYDHIETPDINTFLQTLQQGKPVQPPYKLEDMASDVILLMDALHIKKAHIVGISMGGIIAQITTLNYPERILSLTCIASTNGDPHLPPAKPEVLAFFFAPKKSDESLAAYLDNKIALYKIYNHPEHVDENKLRDLYTKTYHRSHNPSGFKRQLMAMICANPRIERLKKLHIPCLVIHGDYDPTFPLEHGKQLAETLPQAEFHIIEKMGHGLPDVLCEKIVAIIAKTIKNTYNKRLTL